MTAIFAIDPGVTSGVAIARVDNKGIVDVYEQFELGPHDHHFDLWVRLCRIDPAVIVYEDFTYRRVESKGTAMPGIRLESREYIGICKFYNQMYGEVQLVSQPASIVNGKRVFWDAKKLKAVGLYNRPGGRDHINDATGHLLHYCIKQGWGKELLTQLKDPSSDPGSTTAPK